MVVYKVMELRQLHHLLAAADTGSISGAAERVGLTQQALSRSLSRLEESIGGKLLERQARGVVLTRLGQTVAEHAQDVVASTGRLETAAAAELGLEKGKLVIGLSPIAAMTDIGRRMAEFAQAHPGLRIDIESGIDRDFVAALQSGQIDLAVASQMGAFDDSIMVEQITNETWGIAGRVDHPLLTAAGGLKDFDGANWIVGRNTDQLAEAITLSFEAAKASAPRPGVMTTSVLFALRGLSSTDCLAILPQSLCAGQPSILWRDFTEGSWNTPVSLMRRSRAYAGLGVREACQWLTSS